MCILKLILCLIFVVNLRNYIINQFPLGLLLLIVSYSLYNKNNLETLNPRYKMSHFWARLRQSVLMKTIFCVSCAVNGEALCRRWIHDRSKLTYVVLILSLVEVVTGTAV